ncbi:hypothetical protein FS837_008659, partial [Tulasnella sp. UAMH 9824]
MLEQHDCAAASVVCRRWSEVALDELWRSLPSLLPLFELLGPLDDTHFGCDLDPDIVLTAKSWDTFKSYAARVRSLTYEDDREEVEDEDDVSISAGLIMRTLIVHSGEGILPNLRTVRWNVNHLGLNHILAFCPSSLERMSLQIRTEAASVDELKRLLSSLTSSLINRLKFFEFRADFFPDDNALLSTALNNFIKTQPNLLELQLPSYCIRDQAIVSQAYHVPSQLRSFCGELVDTTRQMLRMALDELIRSAPSLRRVVLVRSGNDFAGETLRLADFTPLLQLSEADDIKLCGEFQLHLEPQEIQKMGQAWTGLVT